MKLTSKYSKVTIAQRGGYQGILSNLFISFVTEPPEKGLLLMYADDTFFLVLCGGSGSAVERRLNADMDTFNNYFNKWGTYPQRVAVVFENKPLFDVIK